MKKLLLIGTAALFLATGAAARAAETFDWGKYCGDRNKYCDPSDSEDNKWQPPSTAELRACTKNRKLDYNCLRKSEPSSVLQSLPTSVQKRIKEIRERCLAIERENPPYGTADDDDGLMTFTLSGAQAVLVDELSFCGGECYHGCRAGAGGTQVHAARFACAPARIIEPAGRGLFGAACAVPLAAVQGIALRAVLVARVGRRWALRGRGGLSAGRLTLVFAVIPTPPA